MLPENEKKWNKLGNEIPLKERYPSWFFTCLCNKCKNFRKEHKIEEEISPDQRIKESGDKIDGKIALESARSYEND